MRRAAAARRFSPLAPAVERAVAAVLALLASASLLWLVGDRHAARREAQEACARSAVAEVQRRPILRNVVPLADACLTLARMRGEPR